jgi:F0F1-type ATP synthase epsilon subunit
MIKLNFRSYTNNIASEAENIVILPAIDGIIGILPYHENMVVSLKTGMIIIDNKSNFFINGGIARIQSNIIDIISDFIIEISALTIGRIEMQMNQIKQNIESKKTNIEIMKYKKDLESYLSFQEYISLNNYK